MDNKKKFVWNRDRIFSIGMILFSIAIIYFTGQIRATFNMGSGSDPGSKTFPYAIAILLILSSIGKFITCNKPDEHGFVEGKKGWLRILAVMGLLFVYVIALKYVGFLICTFVGTLGLLAIMRGNRKIRVITYIIYPAILTAVLYFLFNNILMVIMPVGTIWKSLL